MVLSLFFSKIAVVAGFAKVLLKFGLVYNKELVCSPPKLIASAPPPNPLSIADAPYRRVKDTIFLQLLLLTRDIDI